MRKDEHSKRDQAVADSKKKLASYKDKLDQLTSKKPWIKEEQKKDLEERLTEVAAWLDESVEKQKQIPLD